MVVLFQNKDGKLTMEEFREGSKCDPWIVQALAIDLPQDIDQPVTDGQWSMKGNQAGCFED